MADSLLEYDQQLVRQSTADDFHGTIKKEESKQLDQSFTIYSSFRSSGTV